jgi:far upstream element-binding protein
LILRANFSHVNQPNKNIFAKYIFSCLGGDTIKQINQQSGAHCELDRRANAQPNGDKVFVIRGEFEQIEAAKRIISDKVQMPLNFVANGGNGNQGNNPPSNLPTAYPGMAPQGYNPQNWSMPGAQQQPQWGGMPYAPGGQNPGQPGDVSQAQMNPGAAASTAGAGQPDYSLQWAEYYRSLGMMREAELIEQQAKSKGQVAQTAAPVANVQQQQPAVMPSAAAATGASAQPDYSAQWAEYYRSLGKVKEAEAIEAQMKNKTGTAPTPGIQQNTANAAAAAAAYQQYAGYQAQGYYGQQPGQMASAGGAPGNNAPYGGFPGYGYGNAGGNNAGAPPQPQSQPGDN